MSEDSQKFIEEEEETEEALTLPQKLLKAFIKMGDLFVLNVYFTITSLPIITIGASLTALYTVTYKMVDDHEDSIHKAYLKAWKENFKQSTIMWLIDLLYIGMMVIEYIYVLRNENQLSKVLFILVGTQFFFLAFAYPLQFPLLARYENSVGRTMFNSLIIAFSRPGVWFKMFFIWSLPFALYYVSIKALIYTWYLWGLLLTSLFAYICSTFLMPFFRQMEEQSDEQEAEET